MLEECKIQGIFREEFRDNFRKKAYKFAYIIFFLYLCSRIMCVHVKGIKMTRANIKNARVSRCKMHACVYIGTHKKTHKKE